MPTEDYIYIFTTLRTFCMVMVVMLAEIHVAVIILMMIMAKRRRRKDVKGSAVWMRKMRMGSRSTTEPDEEQQ